MRKITLVLIASLILTSYTPIRINLRGGSFGTKSMAMWELHKYRDTELLRKNPLCWCPYKSYLLVGAHVSISAKGNIHYLTIDRDLIKATQTDANYNRLKSKVYYGTPNQKVRQIYNFCRKTKYTPHMKTARDVLKDRKGDCAGIASAFYVLCKKNKIPVMYIIGWANGVCHAWNRVKIGNTWYWIDATHELYLSRKQFKGRSVMEMW